MIMKRFFIILLAASVFMLTGCLTTTACVDRIDPARLHALSDANLAFYYHKINHAPKAEKPDNLLTNVESELSLRGLTESEISLARDGEITVGMSELALLASQGRPLKRRISEYADKTCIEWVYGGNLRVYTEDGVITSIHSER
jgi:hypothetical protein